MRADGFELIHLQVERSRLGRLLFLRDKASKAVGKRIGDEEIHVAALDLTIVRSDEVTAMSFPSAIRGTSLS